MSRSVTVAVAYIMSVTNLSWKEALKVVRAGRAVANPNAGFQKQLQEFEAFKLAEERRRLKERYPSLALVGRDREQCALMLNNYEELLSSKSICEGKCSMGQVSGWFLEISEEIEGPGWQRDASRNSAEIGLALLKCSPSVVWEVLLCNSPGADCIKSK